MPIYSLMNGHPGIRTINRCHLQHLVSLFLVLLFYSLIIAIIPPLYQQAIAQEEESGDTGSFEESGDGDGESEGEESGDTGSFEESGSVEESEDTGGFEESGSNELNFGEGDIS